MKTKKIPIWNKGIWPLFSPAKLEKSKEEDVQNGMNNEVNGNDNEIQKLDISKEKERWKTELLMIKDELEGK